MKYYEFETTEYPISYFLAKEEYLLSRGEEAFFIWNNLPGIVIGKNQILEEEVNVSKAVNDGVKIYRRKSGGGAIYTDNGSFMYTFIIKGNQIGKIYEYCLNRIAHALSHLGIEAEFGGRNDLLVDGKKFSGSAIYLKNNYAIMHGTILFNTDLKKMSEYLTPSDAKLKSKGVKSVASRVTNLSAYTDVSKIRLMKELQRRIGTVKGSFFASEQKVIEKLAARYEDQRWLESNETNYTFSSSKRFENGEVCIQAKVFRNEIQDIKISGDFFETYDIKPLENYFLGARFDKINEAIDQTNVSKFIYGINNDDFKELFKPKQEKKEKPKEHIHELEIAEEENHEEVKQELLKTPLYEEHVKNGGKIVEFGGYLMPLEYSGITKEHHAVRTDAGLFDCSHMGEIKISGNDAMPFLDYLLTSSVSKVEDNKMIYGLLLYPNGSVVDDLMVYKVNNTLAMLVVNASNKLKDYDYIVANKGSFDVEIENESDKCSELALQGPNAIKYLQKLTTYDFNKLKFFDFDYVNLDGKMFNISRSGYTGSDGFEIYGTNEDILALFRRFNEIGVTLCGLGARDTLRFEAAMPLYGHEISDQLNPLEAGLNYAVDLRKDDFLGKDALVTLKEKGLSKKLVGLELVDRGIARGDYLLFKDGKKVGYVTTGYMIPDTTNSYALGYVDAPFNKIGTVLEVQIRNRLVKIKVRDKKFLNKEYVK